MKLSNRSFPHPVVNNADDVPEAGFQAAFDFASDKANFYITATVRCSSETLLKMVKKGTACYTLHVECGGTLYRETFDSAEPTFTRAISAARVHGTVEVNAFVRAKVALPAYRIDGAHPDYGDATFAVGPGDILAVADSQSFPAEHPIDPMRLVGALIEVVRSPKSGVHAMETYTDADKIGVVLCGQDYDAYCKVRAVKGLADLLTATLVLPVLMHAIGPLDDPEAAPDTKWATALRGQLDAAKFGPNADTLAKAQRLLELPIARALTAAVTYTEPPAT